ncbi:MAG: hypothetical protein R3242_02665 [Akkermansiaceae bacterium]|nr:hypothetical protein [Akkermansiaceae bacterium]
MKFMILRVFALLFLTLGLNSCWPLLVGAGAAGGYYARDKGYKFQSPVEKNGGGQNYDQGYDEGY